MPLRPPLPRGRPTLPLPLPQPQSQPLFLRCRRGLHTSHRLLFDDGGGVDVKKQKNHYERLNVRHDASHADIKKSFYSLSKTHHPDANPGNPNASHTFSLLSEAYTVLSDASKRAAYDRQVLGSHHSHHSGHAQHRGSYHSTSTAAASQAGGRSPSGLSRRRGTFRGPPPSFYRSGGWGNQGEKRRRAHEESTGAGGATPDGHHDTASSSSTATGSNSNSSAFRHQAAYGGMGPGDDPFGHHQEVPHFDRHGHLRTHQREDQRRWQRHRRAVGDDDIEFEPQASIAGHFFIIAGILGATLLAPLVYIQFMRLGRTRRDPV